MKRAPKIALTVALLSVIAASGSLSVGAATKKGAQGKQTNKPATVKATKSEAGEKSTSAGNPTPTTSVSTPIPVAQPDKKSDEAPPSAAGMTPAEVLRAATSTSLLPMNTDAPSVEQRIAAFDNRITNGQEEGRLTAAEADNYRTSLLRLAEEAAEYSAAVGKLDSFEDLKLQLAMDRLDREFVMHLHDRKVAIADIAARVSDLRRAIALAASEGRLTGPATQKLVDELKAWHDREARFLSDGQLSYSDSLILSMYIDRIVEHLGRALQPRPAILPDFKTLIAEADKAISAGEAKIPADALVSLKKRLESDKTAIGKLSSLNDEWLRMGQTLTIAADLQEIKGRADLLATGKTTATNLVDRELQLDQKIADALSNGTLTADEAHELEAELDGILSEEKTAGDVTSAHGDQPPRIAVELERLAGQVVRKQHAPRLPWTGISAFHTALDQHIEDAYKSKRITLEQARQFKKSSDDLAAKCKEFNTSGNRLDANEALELAIQLQHVGVELHHAMTDRNIKAPDINALQDQLDKLIAEGVDSGRLEVDDNLTNRVSHVTSLREQYEKSPDGLDTRAKLAVGTAIQHVISQIQAQVHRDELHAPVSLDARLSDLGSEISTSMSRGILSVERAAQYKAALDTIYTELWNDRKKPGGMNAADSLAAANDVSVLQEQLADELRENSSLPRQLIPRYRAIVLDIGRALGAGRISSADADALMGELNHAAWSHVEAAGTQGGLSHGEGLRLSYDLERISTELESKLRDEPIPIASISGKALQVDSELANALVAGKLSVRQAQQYELVLDGILASSGLFSSSDGGITYLEALTTALDLEHLHHEVELAQAASPRGLDIGARQADIIRRIHEAVTSGKLRPKDAELLKYDLDRIADSEEAFRISDEGLNFAEAVTLATNLDRVNARLESLSKGQLSSKGKPH